MVEKKIEHQAAQPRMGRSAWARCKVVADFVIVVLLCMHGFGFRGFDMLPSPVSSALDDLEKDWNDVCLALGQPICLDAAGRFQLHMT